MAGICQEFNYVERQLLVLVSSIVRFIIPITIAELMTNAKVYVYPLTQDSLEYFPHFSTLTEKSTEFM